MKYEIELPDEIVKDGVAYEPTGEFRNPKKGEAILWLRSVTITGRDFDESEPYIILRPKWVWPEWLGGWGFVRTARHGAAELFWASKEQVLHPSHGGDWTNPHDGLILSMKKLSAISSSFIPPVITDWTKPIINPNWNKDAK